MIEQRDFIAVPHNLRTQGLRQPLHERVKLLELLQRVAQLREPVVCQRRSIFARDADRRSLFDGIGRTEVDIFVIIIL